MLDRDSLLFVVALRLIGTRNTNDPDINLCFHKKLEKAKQHLKIETL
jgi:hypothetical protein